MTKYKNKNNVFDWKYTIYPDPIINNNTEYSHNVHVQNEYIQNSHNKINTDITNDKLDKANHNNLTNLIIEKGYVNEDNYDLIKYDNLFNSFLSNNYSYDDLSTIASYISSKIKSNNFEDENYNPIENKFEYFKSLMDENVNMLFTSNENTKSDELFDYDWLNDDII